MILVGVAHLLFLGKEILMFCPKCGKENLDQAVLCDSCGFSLRGVNKKKKGDSWQITCM